MKKIYLSLLSVASLGFITFAFAEDAPQSGVSASVHQATDHFTAEQVGDIKKVITEYISQNPNMIMVSLQAGMVQKQKEENEKTEKAVSENKDKIFKNKENPVAGNVNGTESLVVFMDPYCGYCKKFHGEIDNIISKNKDVKITFIDVPIMGPSSVLAIKAMFAAKAQGKYDQLQKAIFAAETPLSKKEILKIADSLGIDIKKLDADMKRKGIQEQVKHNAELAKTLGINGTPTLIIGETKVVPGFVSAEEVNKMLKETPPSPTENKGKAEKAS